MPGPVTPPAYDAEDSPTEEQRLPGAGPMVAVPRRAPTGTLDDRAQIRLVEAMRRYREATRRVEQLLSEHRLGREQPYLFSLNRRPIENIARHSKQLAVAEYDRRAARAALHAVSELIALDPVPPPQAMGELGEIAELRHWHASLTDPGEELEALRHTDRLISIIEYADANGCTYADETFLPVELRLDFGEPSRPSGKRG